MRLPQPKKSLSSTLIFMKNIQDSLIQDPFFEFMSLFKDLSKIRTECFPNLTPKNYHYMLQLHSQESKHFADGHIGLLSQLSLLVFHGCLLILKDIEFNVKVTLNIKDNNLVLISFKKTNKNAFLILPLLFQEINISTFIWLK